MTAEQASANLKPTAARLALMRAVAAAEVTRIHYWNHGRGPDRIVVRWNLKTVTGRYNELQAAGLVRLGASGASMYHPRSVELTDAGQQWLTDAEQD
jgi:hypothetical protein